MSIQRDAARFIANHVTSAIAVADHAGLTDVGINLNQALVALGHPGIPPTVNQGQDTAGAITVDVKPPDNMLDQ